MSKIDITISQQIIDVALGEDSDRESSTDTFLKHAKFVLENRFGMTVEMAIGPTKITVEPGDLLAAVDEELDNFIENRTWVVKKSNVVNLF